ncbi:GntR family transcriptional regulator [Lentisphaerota bacterium ZTH]|nr:GntR family transcriptional regulator [Lentisphaerota bacterium]WET06533.1 GntR family transcriptional regulator [Lentisphaerota bacterium ZTH]
MASISKRQQRVDSVRKWIVKKTLPEGQYTNEFELCAKFAMSRTQVRDILKELEVQNIIVRRQRKGIRVREIPRKEAFDVFEILEALEVIAIRKAAVSSNPRDIDTLRKHAYDFNLAHENKDVKAKKKSDIAFHKKILDMSGNEAVKHMACNYLLIEEAFKIGTPGRPDPLNKYSIASHEAIVDALEARDVINAEKLIKQHFRFASVV